MTRCPVALIVKGRREKPKSHSMAFSKRCESKVAQEDKCGVPVPLPKDRHSWAQTQAKLEPPVRWTADSMYFSFRFPAAPSSVTSSDTDYRCPHLRMAMSISCRRPLSHADTEKRFCQLYQGPVSAGIWKCSSTASLRALRGLRLGWGEGRVNVSAPAALSLALAAAGSSPWPAAAASPSWFWACGLA